MGIEVPIRLRSIEAYRDRKHGASRDLGVDELRVLDRIASAMVETVETAWPVDTSTSRDAFAYRVVGRRDRIAIVIENDVDYVQYIHRAGTPADPPLYVTLIPEVWDRFKPIVLSAMRAAIDNTEAIIRQERAKGKAGLTVRQILAGRRPIRAPQRAA